MKPSTVSAESSSRVAGLPFQMRFKVIGRDRFKSPLLVSTEDGMDSNPRT